MKTVSFEKAKWIAEDFHFSMASALYSFAKTGKIEAEHEAQYFKEIAEVLQQERAHLRKDIIEIKKLKSFFLKYFGYNNETELAVKIAQPVNRDIYLTGSIEELKKIGVGHVLIIYPDRKLIAIADNSEHFKLTLDMLTKYGFTMKSFVRVEDEVTISF